VTLGRGWVGACFASDPTCMDWMAKVSQIDGRHIRVNFEVKPTLWGTPGIPATIAALMVLPRGPEVGEPGELRSDTAEEFSSNRRQPIQ
jgi:hypothetical protein